VQHVSDLIPKFAVRTKATPYVKVWYTSVYIQSVTADIRREKKERQKKDGRQKKPQGKNIMVCPIP